MTDLASALDKAIGALNEVRRAYTAENFDESLVKREHGRFARQDGSDDGPVEWTDAARQAAPIPRAESRSRYSTEGKVRARLQAAFPNARIDRTDGWRDVHGDMTEWMHEEFSGVTPGTPEWDEEIERAERAADRVVAVYDGLEQMAAQFPEAAQRVTSIDMAPGVVGNGADAVTMLGPGRVDMTFSLDWMVDRDDHTNFNIAAREASDQGDLRYWSFGVAVHEWGHVLDGYAAAVEHGAEFTDNDYFRHNMGQPGDPIVAAWDAPQYFDDHFDLAAGEVSTYAMTEPAEFAAEAFAYSRLDPVNVPDDARDIVEWLEDRAHQPIGGVTQPQLVAASIEPDGTPSIKFVDVLNGDCVPVRYAFGMLAEEPHTAAIAGPAEIIREIPDKFVDDKRPEPRRAYAEDQERDPSGRWVNEPGRGDDAPHEDRKPGKTPDEKKQDRPPGTLTKKGVVCGDGSVVKIGDKVAVRYEVGLSFDRFTTTGYGKAVAINDVGGIGVKFEDGSRRYYEPDAVSTGVTKIGDIDEGKVDSVLFGDKEYTDKDFDALLELAPQVFGGGDKPEHGLDLGKGDIGHLAKAFGANARVAFAEFDPTKHPRGERGKFTFKEPEAESPPETRDYAITDPVPPEPGTTPIPDGYVRFYHYTRIPEDDRPVEERLHAAAESLRTGGLRLGDARGETYGEPNMVWASAAMPDPNESVFAEFAVPMGDPRWIVGNSMEISADSTYEGKYVAPDGKAYNTSPDYFAQRGSNVAFNADIRPDEIISVNEPWHAAYRYFADSPESVANVLAGDHDDLLDDPRYGPAIRRIKADGGIQAATRRAYVFDESAHPRDEGGRFTFGGGESARADQPGVLPDGRADLESVPGALNRWVMGGSASDMQYAAHFIAQGMDRNGWLNREGNRPMAGYEYDAAKTLMDALPDQPREPVMYRGVVDVPRDRFTIPLEVGATYDEPLASWSTDKALADQFQSGELSGGVSARPDAAITLTVRDAPAFVAEQIDARERVSGGHYTVLEVEPAGTIDVESKYHESFAGTQPGDPRLPDVARDGKSFYTNVPAYDVTVEWQPTQQAALSRFARRAYTAENFDESLVVRDERGRFGQKERTEVAGEGPVRDTGERTGLWHLTDDPYFRPDPKAKPEWNSLAGDLVGDARPEGLFVGDPEFWMHAYNYERPYVAEIVGNVTDPPGTVMHQGREHFVQGDDMHTARVLTIDEYAREHYGEPGWVEEYFDSGPSAGPGSLRDRLDLKDYKARDVSEMTSGEIAEYERRFHEYAHRPSGPLAREASTSRFTRRAYTFNEEDHPRDERGRFGEKGGGEDAGKAPASEYGLHYDASYVNDPDLAAAKKWDGWDQVPVTQVDPHTLVAVEDSLSRRSIDKVVSGREPLREGYVVRVVRKDDGTEIIVDGHHRAAMASAMDRPLDVKIADAAEIRGARRAYTAENFDESLVRRERGRFARKDDVEVDVPEQNSGTEIRDNRERVAAAVARVEAALPGVEVKVDPNIVKNVIALAEKPAPTDPKYAGQGSVVDAIEGAATGFERLGAKYPEVAARLGSVTFGKTNDYNALGQYEHYGSDRTIGVGDDAINMPEITINLTRLTGEANRNRFIDDPEIRTIPVEHAPTDVARLADGVVTHEFGHLLDYVTPGGSSYIGHGEAVAFSNASDGHVSEYATRSQREYFAEVFAANELGFRDRLTQEDLDVLASATPYGGRNPALAAALADVLADPPPDTFEGSIIWEYAAVPRTAAASRFARRAYTFDPDAHPRGEHGRFATKEDEGPLLPKDPAFVGAEIADIAKGADWGTLDADRKWGHNTIGSEDFQAARAETMDVLDRSGYNGEQVALAVEGWSSAMDVEFWRDTARDGVDAQRRYVQSLTGTNAPGARYFGQVLPGVEQALEIGRATEIDVPLYRQTGLDADLARSIKVGETLDNRGVSSWSRNAENAEPFGYWNHGSAGVRVEMELEPGAHGLDVAALGKESYAWQDEVIVMDRTLTATDVQWLDDDHVRVKVAPA